MKDLKSLSDQASDPASWVDQAFLKRRAEKPEEPAFHSYAEIYGDAVHVHPGEREEGE